MTKIGKAPPGAGTIPYLPGALPRNDEEKRDRAAFFVLTRAKDAAAAAEILDALGIDPAKVGTRTEEPSPEAPRSTPRRRFH